MTDTKKSKGRWLLIASLSLNLFIVGIIVGGMIIGGAIHKRGGGRQYAPPIHSFASPRSIMHAVERDHRKDLYRLAKADLKELRPLLREVGEARRVAMEEMGAETFSPEEVRAAFAVLVEAEKAAHIKSNETVVSMLATLPDEARLGVIENLKHRRGRHFKGRRSHRSGGDERAFRPPEELSDEKQSD